MTNRDLLCFDNGLIGLQMVCLDNLHILEMFLGYVWIKFHIFDLFLNIAVNVCCNNRCKET